MRALVQQFTDEVEARSVEIDDEQSDQILGKDIGFTKLTDVDSVESLLETMRQEKLFTQQEKLLQIILRTEQGLILRRYIWTLFALYHLCLSFLLFHLVNVDVQGNVGVPRSPDKLAPSINAFPQVFMLQVQLALHRMSRITVVDLSQLFATFYWQISGKGGA